MAGRLRTSPRNEVWPWPWSVRRRPTSPGAPTAGAGTSSCAETIRSALLDGGVDAPWSVDVDPESLL